LHTDGKESHAIVMKAQIQSGNVSKRKTIEVLTESARTGILSAFTMVNEIQSSFHIDSSVTKCVFICA
jgi:hypothetical protein